MELIEAARADDAALVSPIPAREIAEMERKRPGSLGFGLTAARRLRAAGRVSVGLDRFGTADPVVTADARCGPSPPTPSLRPAGAG